MNTATKARTLTIIGYWDPKPTQLDRTTRTSKISLFRNLVGVVQEYVNLL